MQIDGDSLGEHLAFNCQETKEHKRQRKRENRGSNKFCITSSVPVVPESQCTCFYIFYVVYIYSCV